MMGDLGDFSPSATLVTFDPPIPLLRGVLPAGPDDDPSSGPFVLAFKDSRSWKSAFLATRSKIIEQCEAGARAGCSISVSNKCSPPWWKAVFAAKSTDFAERERCEEREMSSCIASAKDACIEFAEEKCIPPFADARIGAAPLKGSPKLAFWAPDSASEAVLDDHACCPGDSTYRGRRLMKSPPDT